MCVCVCVCACVCVCVCPPLTTLLTNHIKDTCNNQIRKFYLTVTSTAILIIMGLTVTIAKYSNSTHTMVKKSLKGHFCDDHKFHKFCDFQIVKFISSKIMTVNSK